MEAKHYSVLLDESIENLNIKPNGVYVDATMGGGGHSEEICKRLSKDGIFIGIDQDQYAQDYAKKRLDQYECKKIFIKDNFSNLEDDLSENGIEKIDGIVFDLGVSSFQLDQEERGFSYHGNGPLDMRMDQEGKLTAKEVVNTYPKEELVRILRDYGEERFAGRIANNIVKQRETKPFETTEELSELVKRSYPAKQRFKGKHPARKTFQALRIEVNKELSILPESFEQAVALLEPGGRMAVITFHSLEDRITKQFIRKQENPCECPPELPVCVCGKKPTLKRVNRKPILPSQAELDENKRSRSAKLRVAEKI